MNHAVVFAAQQFLGFELCSSLLEDGWSVTAIDENDNMEEKWLEIGRNSNIEYFCYEKWDEKIPKDSTIFISYYDLLGGNNLTYMEKIPELLTKEKYSNCPIIRLFPTVRIPLREKNILNKEGRTVTTFYIPTLFGPHQPSSFLFAQLLKNKVDNLNEVNYVDDESSAIYIKDAAKAIVKKANTNQTYQLESELANSWEEALSFLTIEKFQREKAETTGKGTKIVIKTTLPQKEILKEQKRRLELDILE